MTTFGAGSVRGLGRAARLVPPGAPTGFSATGRTRADGAGGANVFFTAPVDNGGAPITAYQIQNVTDNSFQTIYSSGEVVSLSNNAEKTFRVRAVNAAGPGEWSNTDTALAGYWTYNPGNGGGSNTFTVPSGITSIVYQLWSNSGASSKPDTRYYGTRYQANISWWGPSVLDSSWPWYGLPDLMEYSQQYNYYGWWNYTPDWEYIHGYIVYSHGTINGGGHEYYSMITQSSGNGWSSNQHLGWYYVTGNPIQIQLGGSPAAGPTSGTASSISVPGWGSDSTGSGYNGSQSATSGTAITSANANITVNIGYTNGDYGYSSPGAATISYGR
jgi:hypothetical protein